MTESINPRQRSVAGAKIFVSYSRDDKEFAHQLNFMLRDMGFEPLMDVRAIHPGEPWEERLTNLIEQCDKVVFVMTPDYLASPNCSWEVDKANSLDKEMIPVLPQALPEGTVVPDELSRLQYVYFYSDNEAPDSGFYTGTRKLEDAIRTDLDWLSQLRRYQSRAADWQDGQDKDQLLKGGLLAEALGWQKLTPDEADVPSIVAEFIAASQASEQEYIAAQKRRMRMTMAAAVAAIVFAGVAGFFGFSAWQSENDANAALEQAEQNLADLEVARDDNEILASAAEAWAEGTGELGKFKLRGKFDQRCTERGDCPLEFAAERLSNAVRILFPPPRESAEDRDQVGLSGEGRAAFRTITASIRRDYAQALFFQESGAAVSEMDAVISDMRAEIDALSGTADTSELQSTLTDDYLLRAVYACYDEGRVENVFDDLMRGDYLFRRKQPEWPQVESLIKPVPPQDICPAAREALCEVTNCDGARGDTRSLEPIEDEAETEERLTTPSPVFDMLEVDRNQTPEAFRVRQIFLHISDKSQMEAAKAFQAGLEATGDYDVLGIELVDVKYTPSIRYYYNIQEDDVALRLLPDCVTAALEAINELGGAGTQLLEGWTDPSNYKLISLDGRYKGLPRNRIEIWL